MCSLGQDELFLFFSCLSITKKALPTSGLKDYAVGKEGFYGGSVFKMQGLCRLGLEFFSNGPENIYLHQTKQRLICKQQRILKKGLQKYSRQNSIHTTNKSKLQNVRNPDRKEVKVMPQIILYEWKIIFSGSLLHRTPIPWSLVLTSKCRNVQGSVKQVLISGPNTWVQTQQQ